MVVCCICILAWVILALVCVVGFAITDSDIYLRCLEWLFELAGIALVMVMFCAVVYKLL